MRVIITGGTGLIGTALSQSLIQDGHETIILSRDPSRYNLPPGAIGAKWDGKTAVSWGHLVNEADAIVNLAGENLAGSGLLPTRWSAERKQLLRQSRLDAGRAVVEAVTAAERKPRVVIQASGIDYYGDLADEIVTEKSPAGSGFLADLTVEWEASTAAVTQQGVRHVAIRTGVVLSAEGGPLKTITLPFKFFVGGPLGSGKQWMSWIHIADEVAAIRFLLEAETAVGPFNLCAPEPLTNKAFSQAVGRAMGRPSFLPIPAFALRLALGEVADVVLNGRRALPKKLQERGFTFQFPTADSALQDLLTIVN
jgi:uncharacterized protein